MIIIISGGILVAGIVIALSLRLKYKKEISTKEYKIQFLLDQINLIYNEGALNFALYAGTGERTRLVINGKYCENNSVSGGILSNNLFENPIFTPEIACKLEAEGCVNCEIDTSGNLYTNLNSEEDAVYHIIIKKLDNPTHQYIVTVWDITTNTKNAESKRRFDKLVEFATKKSQVGIAYYNVCTHEGRATDSWYDNLCETRKGEINPDYTHVAPPIKQSILSHLQSLQKGEKKPLVLDCEIKGPNGVKWIREHIFIHHSSADHIQVIDINLDITELKENENILTALNHQVLESKQESDKFLNSISHEIRTPLNSIVGFSGLYANADSTEEKARFEEIIRMNVNQLIELVNNIIVIARLDSHSVKIIPESIKLHKLLSHVRDETEQLFKHDKAYEGKDITIEFNLPDHGDTILSDKKLLYLVFSNLISNALKFTDKGYIIIGYCQKENIYDFYVKDTGKGIDPKHFEKLFDRFEKVDTFTQGTGLGLPLCKSIITMLGGEIYVKSEQNKGTEFHFTLTEK